MFKYSEMSALPPENGCLTSGYSGFIYLKLLPPLPETNNFLLLYG